MVEAFKAVLAGGDFNKDDVLAAEVSHPVDPAADLWVVPMRRPFSQSTDLIVVDARRLPGAALKHESDSIFVSRPVLRVLAKYLSGGWDCLGPRDMAALGQDPYDLMGRPFCRISAMAVMADAYFELGRELNKHGIDLGFAD